jgi:uncharacterized protein (TIGR00266 family)
MEYDIKYTPSFSLLEIRLKGGEQVTAEAGAMIYMTEGIEIKTRTRRGGLFQKVKVSMLGGESFFVNDYVAKRPAKVGLAASPLGDIQRLDVQPGKGFVIQSGAYVASTKGVNIDTEWQGFKKGIFGTQLFMLKSTGQGDIFVNAFGAVDHHKLGPGEKMTVDNYHLVAFTDSCKYDVKKFGGLKSTILGGEGLVTEVSGPGEIYIQTKNPREFALWMAGFLPRDRSGRGSEFTIGGFKFGR